MRFEPYTRKMGCVAVQQDGKWWVAHPNGDAESATSKDDAQAKALYNNTTGGAHGTVSGSPDWQRPALHDLAG
jgi:hypothetical protein